MLGNLSVLGARSADFDQRLKECGFGVNLIICPIICLSQVDDSDVHKVGKLSLSGLEGKACLEHDLPLIKRSPGMATEKSQDPRTRGRPEQFDKFFSWIFSCSLRI